MSPLTTSLQTVGPVAPGSYFTVSGATRALTGAGLGVVGAQVAPTGRLNRDLLHPTSGALALTPRAARAPLLPPRNKRVNVTYCY